MTFNTLRIDITIYHTYMLLNCKGHIQMMSNDSTINMKTKNNRINKIIKLHLIHLDYLHYNISHLPTFIL